jgi:dienelactone hydrolase
MNQFLAGTAGQKSTVISGSLDLPNNVEKPIPAVVILHGAGGIHSNEKKMGFQITENRYSHLPFEQQ